MMQAQFLRFFGVLKKRVLLFLFATIFIPAMGRSLSLLSVKDRVLEIQSQRGELWNDININLPQQTFVLIAYKKNQILELWTTLPTPQKIKTYPWTATSGKLGPKLKQGDKQIPEGVYHLTHLNPMSQYHLSIGVNYPNTEDRQISQDLKVLDPGGDIFIHGRNKTIGCIPIGDVAIEELFVLVSRMGVDRFTLLIAPTRLPLPHPKTLVPQATSPALVKKYDELKKALMHYQSY